MLKSRVIENFAKRKPNPHHGGRVLWRTPYQDGQNGLYRQPSHVGHVLFAEDDMLYSFRTSWPLAHYLGEVDGKRLFLKNGDRSSSTTNGHLSEVQRVLAGPTLSRSALNGAGISFSDLKLSDILDWAPDKFTYLFRDKNGRMFERAGSYPKYKAGKRFPMPVNGMFMADSHSGDTLAGYEPGYWHTLSNVLFIHDGAHYLSGMDEGSYFLSKLSGKPKTIKAALTGLKPRRVILAESKGIKVERQGEWFFVPTGKNAHDLGFRERDGLVKQIPDYVRPTAGFGLRRNEHHAVVVERKKEIFARGRVVHRTPFGHLSGEHRSLKLGKNWHWVFRNTEVESWTSQGRVD